MERRHFLKTVGGACFASSLNAKTEAQAESLFQISLAEWSVHKLIFTGKITNLDFPAYAKEKCGIDAVEYVNGLFREKPTDAYLAQLNQRCEDAGVKSLLVMVDGEGAIGKKEAAGRAKTVENHKKWLHAAKVLGCHSIRVNASGFGKDPEEKAKHCVDGLRGLSEVAQPLGLNVLVENHGGLSSNGAWLAKVLKDVEMPNCGSLPDFGNFTINKKTQEVYDRYQGMEELMPFAKSVSAKSYDFDSETGEETTIDYLRMIKIMLEHGYHGHVGIEFEGKKSLNPAEGIQKTKVLLEKVRNKLA